MAHSRTQERSGNCNVWVHKSSIPLPIGIAREVILRNMMFKHFSASPIYSTSEMLLNIVASNPLFLNESVTLILIYMIYVNNDIVPQVIRYTFKPTCRNQLFKNHDCSGICGTCINEKRRVKIAQTKSNVLIKPSESIGMLVLKARNA